MIKLVLHYILRDRIKYEIIVTLFISVFSSTNSPQDLYRSNFYTTLLDIFLILYSSVMNTHRSKFLSLHQPRNIEHLRKGIMKLMHYLPNISLVLAIILDFFTIKSIYLAEHHPVSMIIFYISTRIVKVNIKKNAKTDEPMVKLKECVSVLRSVIMLVGVIFITKISVFSSSL